jgi:hypothetical protein
MPTELILWLIEGHNGNNKIITKTSTKTVIKITSKSDLVFMIDDKMINELLDKLPKEYNDNYLKWLMY